MLVNLYKAKTPLSVFSLPLVVAMVSTSIFFGESIQLTYFFDWQQFIFEEIHHKAWLNYSLTVVLISFNAHQINTVFNRNTFYSKDSFLPGFLYLIGLISFGKIQMSPDLLAHFFVLMAFAAVLQLKRQESSKNLVFLGSLSIGVALIFSPLLMPLVLFPWLSLLIIKPFDWREWFVAVLGVGLPFLYHYAIYFLWTGSWLVYVKDVALISPDLVWTIGESVLYISATLSILICLIGFLSVMRAQVVNFKKISQVTFVGLLILIVSFLGGWYFYDLFNCAFMIPLGFIMSAYLLYHERATVVHGLIVVWFLAAVINLWL